MSTRRTNPDKLPSRILSFFSDNPDEELTYADIAAKFEVSQEWRAARCAT